MHRCYISYNLLQKYLNYATVTDSYFTILDTALSQRAKEYNAHDYFDQYRDTESELMLKKRLISEMLEHNVKSTKDNFELGTKSMLTHTTA